MNWVLGLVGALFGIAISGSHELLGALLGFFVLFFLGSMSKLTSRMTALERELATFRAEIAAQQARERAGTIRPAVAPPPPLAAAAKIPVQPPPEAAVPPQPATVDRPVRVSSPTPATTDEAPRPQPAPVQAARSVPPPLPRAQPSVPPPPNGPHWSEKLTDRIRSWFTEGNVPVKVGILVLFFGIAAGLRYAVANNYIVVPIEVRYALIAAGGIAGLLIGWRERERRPAFGLSVQGGGIGILMMTVFAAYRLQNLLPSGAAFALIVILVAGSALLAVLQDAMALAALGFLGGYLAPVLISTGSHDHVALFSYYAVLNAAVFGVSWKRSWRMLNLIGFVFTFGVGTVWGVRFYRPELFASVEPFLILFFVFYVVIGLLYVLRQTEHRKPWVDGTLVFGTPLLAFPLQAGLLKDDRMGLAFSALAVALLYGGLVWWLRQRRGERLLTDAYAALALGFSTLAVPLAFHAGTTGSVWALEGAGVAWLGIRQNRTFPWFAGLGLQVMAACAYILSAFDHPSPVAGVDILLLNQPWLGAALIAIAGYALNFVHDRLRPIRVLPEVLFAWATLWWLVAGVTQMDLADSMGFGAWQYARTYFAVTIAIAALLRLQLPWPRMARLVAVCAVIALTMTVAYDRRLGGPFAPDTLGSWAAYMLAMVWALRSARDEPSRSFALSHICVLWTLAVAAMIQAHHMAGDAWQLADGWQEALTIAPVLIATFVLWRRPAMLAWPRAQQFETYRNGWFAPASLVLACFFVVGLFFEGSTAPLAYVPILNPLELASIAILALLYAMSEGTVDALRKLWPYAGFALVTSATLRAVHHWHGEPWSEQVFDSGVSQMALTLVWSLIGVSTWILGSRRGNRRLWMGGAVLMGVVLLKLITLDRHYMGDVQGITSFLVVGVLMVGVGYIAPSPPKPAAAGPAGGAAAAAKTGVP